MEGLSGFDRSLMKRLESSALAFYELRQSRQCEELRQYNVAQSAAVFAEAAGTPAETSAKHERRSISDASSSSSSSLVSVKQLPGDAAAEARVARQTSSDMEDDAGVLTRTSKSLAAVTTPSATGTPHAITQTTTTSSSSSSITFSISRILGHHDSARSSQLTGPRRPGLLHRLPAVRRTVTPPAERTRCQSGMASPDSSCRVAGDDVDVKTSDDVGNDVDNDDNDSAPITHDSAAAAAAAAAAGVICGDALHRLSWLQCTRYKPPKLPRNYIFSRLYI